MHLIEQPDSLTREEMEAAIRSLPKAGWRKLEIIAAKLAWGRPIEANDLQQEALLGAIERRRSCPRGLDIVRFLAGVMQSIASDSIKKVNRHPELRTVSLFDETGKMTVDPPEGQLTAEEAMIEAQEEQRLKGLFLALFDDDLIHQTIAEGLWDGIQGEELRALTDLDETRFASARRYVRRRIAKAYPKESKP